MAVNCWVVSTGMIGFSGVTVMEAGCPIGLPPPHMFKETARRPTKNIAEKNLNLSITRSREESDQALQGQS